MKIKVKQPVLIMLASVFLTACSDARFSQLTSLGSSGKITCFSGGKEIINTESTGKIHAEEQSDGWFFKDKTTGDLIRVSGDCVIRN